jgi:hypothetical protein
MLQNKPLIVGTLSTLRTGPKRLACKEIEVQNLLPSLLTRGYPSLVAISTVGTSNPLTKKWLVWTLQPFCQTGS